MAYGSVTLLLLGWGLMAVVMVTLYAYQKNHANAGIVDVGWAAGVGFLAILGVHALLRKDDPGLLFY